jgi:hypothetical protein
MAAIRRGALFQRLGAGFGSIESSEIGRIAGYNGLV